jgi:hypothetical protein
LNGNLKKIYAKEVIMADELNTIRGILKHNRENLLKRQNVVATGIGYKETSGTKTTTLSAIIRSRPGAGNY